MDSRREFIKKAMALSGAAGLSSVLPPSIQRALAIDPIAGSTFLDAEHVVILMQENRSFDHCFGTLQGVRGFNDPRAIHLPDNNKVWLQTNEAGKTYVPFRLNIHDTKATWMGSLPHSWPDQVDARNEGHHDQWLNAKQSSHPDYKDMPLTLGYYNRDDIPFYYALADAFTVCDQNFCSSITGTTPNRLFLWTGTVRDDKNTSRVRNSELDYDVPADWTTFPERLEEHGLSWKVYQNEISAGVGFTGEEDSWLANFTDNPLEWFSQYHVKFHPAYVKHLPVKIKQLQKSISDTDVSLGNTKAIDRPRLQAQREHLQKDLLKAEQELAFLTPENYNKLSAREKSIHAKAFGTNSNDPDYHSLSKLSVDGVEMAIPKGDVLHQFRKDVADNKLPLVSWLVAPENFSDHPTAPWYGAWYVSEALDILTKNEATWKKTIFILCYDENDGYFDHVPPFVPPHPNRKDTGTMSDGLDSSSDYVLRDQELRGNKPEDARESPVGLGYRVPLVIASPWSRGGIVNSQVFDHTSILQFLEKFASHKAGKTITETNISAWRRAVCGDLTSAFTAAIVDEQPLPVSLSHDEVLTAIHRAKNKVLPTGFKALTRDEITKVNDGFTNGFKQETGVRVASALPYELYVHGSLSADRKNFMIEMTAAQTNFGKQAAGSPFLVYQTGLLTPRSYTVKAGDTIRDSFDLLAFGKSPYIFRVYGPNGYYREFTGTAGDPGVLASVRYELVGGIITGNVIVDLNNTGATMHTITLQDRSYKQQSNTRHLAAGGKVSIVLNLKPSRSWYDIGLIVKDSPAFMQRFAGRVETGKPGFTDPLMGA